MRDNIRYLLGEVGTRGSVMALVHDAAKPFIDKWLIEATASIENSSSSSSSSSPSPRIPDELVKRNDTFKTANDLLDQAYPLCATFVIKYFKFALHRCDMIRQQRNLNATMPAGIVDRSVAVPGDENPVRDGVISLVPPINKVYDFDISSAAPKPEDIAEDDCQKHYLSTAKTGRRTGETAGW